MAFQTGDGGYVDIDGQRLDVETWEINPSISEDETTNTGSDGYYESVGCVKKCTGKVTCKWDAAAMPTTDPPGLLIGARPALKLYVGDSVEYHDFPVVLITTTPTSLDAKTVVKFSFDFVNQGIFTLAS